MSSYWENKDNEEFAIRQDCRDLSVESDATKEFDSLVDMTTEPAKVEKTHDEPMVSDHVLVQRWSAFDRLLLVSFGLISPAYVFTGFHLDL